MWDREDFKCVSRLCACGFHCAQLEMCDKCAAN